MGISSRLFFNSSSLSFISSVVNMIHFLIPAVDLKYNDLAFVLAGDYRIDFIIGGKPDMGCIQFYHFADLFPIPSILDSHTIDHILSSGIGRSCSKNHCREKIDIDHPVIVRNIILLHFGDLLHLIIQTDDPDAVAGIFINKKISADLTGYFKIHPAGIILFMVRNRLFFVRKWPETPAIKQ